MSPVATHGEVLGKNKLRAERHLVCSPVNTESMTGMDAEVIKPQRHVHCSASGYLFPLSLVAIVAVNH